MQTFGERLAEAVRRAGNAVCVGLDPRLADLPEGFASPDATLRNTAGADAIGRFCREVVDVVADRVAVVKPQVAFFELHGPPGMQALAETIAHAQARGLLVIADGKRNDIGSTAEAYADAWLGADSAFGADALTVNAYLGSDSLEPFVAAARTRQAGAFVLAKTSNPGGGELQDLSADGQPVYRRVADLVERLAAVDAGPSGYGSIGAVVGATYPEQLSELRAAMPHAWLLVPGYGSQGATARDVAGAFDAQGLGAVVNSARAILYAHRRREYADRFSAARWQEAVAAATDDMIAELAACSPAGQLAAR